MAELDKLKPESELHRRRFPLYLVTCIISVVFVTSQDQECIFTFRTVVAKNQTFRPIVVLPAGEAPSTRCTLRFAADLCFDRTSHKGLPRFFFPIVGRND